MPVLCGARLTGAAILELSEYARNGLPRRERSGKGLRATTMADYEYYVRNDIAPSALGRMKLIDICRYHVQEFVAHQGRTRHGDRTAARDASGTIFTSAVKDELISANPAQGADRPRLDREPVHPWEPEQALIFLGRCAQHRLGSVPRWPS